MDRKQWQKGLERVRTWAARPTYTRTAVRYAERVVATAPDALSRQAANSALRSLYQRQEVADYARA